jgi:hypothetical protein
MVKRIHNDAVTAHHALVKPKVLKPKTHSVSWVAMLKKTSFVCASIFYMYALANIPTVLAGQKRYDACVSSCNIGSFIAQLFSQCMASCTPVQNALPCNSQCGSFAAAQGNILFLQCINSCGLYHNQPDL